MNRMLRTKTIYLESTTHPIIVTPEVYDRVAALVQAARICQNCGAGYSEENPMVVENVCLTCFLQKHNHLTFAGEVYDAYALEHGFFVYKFLDTQGYVRLTNSNSNHQQSIERSIRETLVHHGFPVPATYRLNEQTVPLDGYSWRQIYGDFRHYPDEPEKDQPVVLAVYYESYSTHISAVFLLYRDGSIVELNKRKGETRVWYQEAKKEIEATWNPQNGYVVGTRSDGEAWTVYRLEEHHFYPGIVASAAARYRQTHGAQ